MVHPDTKHPLPPPDLNMFGQRFPEPTGEFRLRVGWFGRLYVEQEVRIYFSTRLPGEGYCPGQWSSFTRWERLPRRSVFPIKRPSHAHPS